MDPSAFFFSGLTGTMMTGVGLTDRIRIGVSSCLLGQKLRYDGGHKLDRRIKETLGRHLDLLAVCPEVECGLPTPREPLRLNGDPKHPRLVGVMSGVDHTEDMEKWTRRRVTEFHRQGLSGFIFKSRSPSCGMRGVKVHTGSGVRIKKGAGLFARAFMERFPLVPVEDDDRLGDSEIRENFIERVFVYWRWQQFEKDGRSAGGLVRFHADHKLSIISHSPKHYTELGRLVAGSWKKQSDLRKAYAALLMEGMRLTATRKKHMNVLYHIAGCFKKQLAGNEREELLGLIDQYRAGLTPLIAPIVLLNHYARKYDEPYLRKQYYLNPHPIELMLRNHA